MKNLSNKVSVVTVTLECEGSDAPKKEYRDEILKKVVQTFGKEDIILLPAGFYDVRNSKEEIQAVVEVSRLLSEMKAKSVVCMGIDVGNDTQLAVAIDRSGVIAKGRKFFPAGEEKDYLNLAKSYDSEESGYKRFFPCNKKQFYLAVCYDVFGIRKRKIANPGVDAVLNLVHGFTRSGQGSGLPFFVKFGFAAGSLHWDCPVFSAAVFFDKKVKNTKWQPGFKCRKDVKSLRSIKYADKNTTDNQLKFSEQNCAISTKYERAFCWLSTI
jgi:hypothetical protein